MIRYTVSWVLFLLALLGYSHVNYPHTQGIDFASSLLGAALGVLIISTLLIGLVALLYWLFARTSLPGTAIAIPLNAAFLTIFTMIFQIMLNLKRGAANVTDIGAQLSEAIVTGVLLVALISVVLWIFKLTNEAKSSPQNVKQTASGRKLLNSEAEEQLYELIRQEIESGKIRGGLWTKAEATANSIDKGSIRARYIQLRFEQLESQSHLQPQRLSELEKPTTEITHQMGKQVADQDGIDIETAYSEDVDELSDITYGVIMVVIAIVVGIFIVAATLA